MYIKRYRSSTLWLAFCTCAVYLFLYLPLAIVLVFSFNASGSGYYWAGFTLTWYKQLWQSYELMQACKNSFIIASSAAFLSVTLGLWFVYYGISSGLSKTKPLFYATVALPDIIIAIGLLSFFMALNVQLGLITLIVGHTLLGLGFVIPLLAARLEEFDMHLTEAALDLGATQKQLFFNVIVPLLMPSLMASLLLVFMISLDDFLIAFFCSDSGTQTLSLYVFSLIRAGASPLINALSTIILLLSSAFVLTYLYLQSHDDEP